MTMSASILIIDDTKTLRQQILEILQQAELFEHYHEAGDGIEGFKTLLSESIDVILCDVEMPGMDGFKFLRMVASREELQDIPVILLTSHGDDETKIRGLEEGASDYVTKPFNPAELLARVKVQLKIKSLQDRLKESNRQLRELSLTDALTGLANRRHLMDILTVEFERSRRTDTPFSLLMLDLDHFKRINDDYGHQQGDTVLRALAELMKSHLRQYDTAARYGGEEFALVLPETDLVEAAGVAERLRREVAELVFAGPLNGLSLTTSVGVASTPHKQINHVEDMIRIADEALYSAKESGRNRVEVMDK